MQEKNFSCKEYRYRGVQVDAELTLINTAKVENKLNNSASVENKTSTSLNQLIRAYKVYVQSVFQFKMVFWSTDEQLWVS